MCNESRENILRNVPLTLTVQISCDNAYMYPSRGQKWLFLVSPALFSLEREHFALLDGEVWRIM